MKSRLKNELNFEIDKLTNSIENVVTGDSFQTDVSIIDDKDRKSIIKKNGWVFDWKKEALLPDRDVYKLTIVNNPHIIQGLISLSILDGYVVMHLLESAPFNKGKQKVYAGVSGNLVAFACKVSFQRKCDGYVFFIAKTKLIDHYINIVNATHIGGQRMIINTEAALKLINKYYPEK